jgi:hypothetical protein
MIPCSCRLFSRTQYPCTVDAPGRDNKTERQPCKSQNLFMPSDIRNLLQKLLPDLPGQDSYAGEFSYRPVGGGSINSAFQILTKSNKRWFGKFNHGRHFPGLFMKESNGTNPLSAADPSQSFRFRV